LPQNTEQPQDEIIYGRNAVLEALKSGRIPVRRLNIARNSHGPVVEEIFERARALHIPFDILDRTALDRVAGDGRHQGVLAYTAAREFAEFDELLDRLEHREEPALLVFLDGIQDPHNLGAIMRTAYSVGADGIVFEQRRSASLTASAVKAAAGAADYLPACRVTNLRQAMEAAKKSGMWFTGLALDGDDFKGFDYRGPCGLVIGGEGKGLRPTVSEACDFRALIPMATEVIGSLNASVAAGIVLYEVFRQRSATAAAGPPSAASG